MGRWRDSDSWNGGGGGVSEIGNRCGRDSGGGDVICDGAGVRGGGGHSNCINP